MNETPLRFTLTQDDRRQLYLLLGVIGTYLLGVGAARYLVGTVEWDRFGMGLFWVILLQLAGWAANRLYLLWQPGPQNPPPSTEEELALRKKTGSFLLLLAVAALSVAALVSITMYRSGWLSSETGLWMAAGIVLLFALVLAPVRLIERGFGELTLAVLVCNLVPIFALLLQTRQYSNLIAFSTFPLTMLFLSMLIALQLEDYGQDCLYCRNRLLVKIGWEWGIRIHSGFIIATYFLIGLAVLQGVPWRMVWPVSLTVILAGFQVFLLNRVADGQKPDWRMVKFAAVDTFALAVYMLAYSFWIG